MPEPTNDIDLEPDEQAGKRSGMSGSGGAGAVYTLGLIGAGVWFWGQADDPRGRALGLLKALVWPAFLVHDAFRALQRLQAPAPSDQ